MNIEISIIIPIYNVEDYLEECIESILNQEYDLYEIICIDDASTDRTYNLLLNYQDNSKVRIYRNSENKGQSYTRNRGISLAKGKYILFVDSDDYLHEKCLKTIENVLKKSNYDFISFGYGYLKDGIYKQEASYEEREFQDGIDYFCELVGHNEFIAGPCARCYSRKFILNNNIRFREGIVYEDMLFSLEICKYAKKIWHMQDALYIYRKHNNSTMGRIDSESFRSLVIVIYEINKYMKKILNNSNLYRNLCDYIASAEAAVRKHYLYLGTYDIFLKDDEKYKAFFEREFLEKEFITSRYYERTKYLEEVIEKEEKFILFGAGYVAADFLFMFPKLREKLLAIIVSKKINEPDKIEGIPVMEVKELINIDKETLVILAVSKNIEKEVEGVLKESGFSNFLSLIK